MTQASEEYDLHEYAKFIKVLMADADAAGDLARLSGLPVARRAFARAVLAWIEGNVSMLRATALVVCGRLLDPGEAAILSETSYELNTKATVVARPKFTRLEDSLRFTCAVLSKHLGLDHRLELGGRGWEAFKRSVQVRNRVTHPRRHGDLDVSDSELDDLRETMHWSCTEFGKLWNEVMRNHPEAEERLKADPEATPPQDRAQDR